MFHLPGSIRVLAISLLASLVPTGAACAEHFKFIVLFTDGSLAGNAYAGYFSTDNPSGYFTPAAPSGNRLVSLEIVIDGARFTMQDDIAFPTCPASRSSRAKPPSSTSMPVTAARHHRTSGCGCTSTTAA